MTNPDDDGPSTTKRAELLPYALAIVLVFIVLLMGALGTREILNSREDARVLCVQNRDNILRVNETWQGLADAVAADPSMTPESKATREMLYENALLPVPDCSTIP